ncbi:phage infection protein [Bacillus vallismortis]|uniref:YhgE/Pip domain-containing protein n=2 Tax=Bacillus TaxID=1386 RepID=UPI000C2A7D7B|nr:ABC transporter permease [Bacillus vallismortis]PJZ01649.1 phage infection protein [Bacillus vallismortis]
MNFFKQKLILLSPIMAFLVVAIFCLSNNPTVNPEPKDIPIAIVNNDHSVKISKNEEVNVSKEIVKAMKSKTKASAGKDAIVKWIDVNSEEKAQEELNNQKYYAAIIIPKSFTEKQLSFQTEKPINPEVKILINQGMNPVGVKATEQVINKIYDSINTKTRAEITDLLKQNTDKLSFAQSLAMVTPIKKETKYVNEVSSHSANGNAPISIFQPLWMASLICSALVFLAIKKITCPTKIEKLYLKLWQIVLGILLSFIVGFSIVWISVYWLDLNIPNYTNTALFLTLSCFCIYLLISAILSWIGIAGIPLFAIVLFISLPILNLPKEFLTSFNYQYVNSWLPSRFVVDGLRELLYFKTKLQISDEPVKVLIYIGIISLIVLILSILKRSKNDLNNARANTAELSN